MERATVRTIIRDAVETDLVAIRAIYNDAVLTTTASFDFEARSPEKQREWFDLKLAAGFPVLVADVGGRVAGFASYGAFRAWPGYRYTVEHSLYVATDCRRRGLASALLESLIGRASAAGYHVMIAGIDATNDASIRLHERFGFESAGRLSEVGRKFDRWLDLVFVQRRLPGPGVA